MIRETQFRTRFGEFSFERTTTPTMSSRTPARSRQALMSPKSATTAGGWRAKVRKGMKDVCHADMVDEALQRVMDAPEAKVDAARDRFCPPYKPARWAPFLAEVLGRGAAARLLASDADAAEGEPASPVRAMRALSPPASPRRRSSGSAVSRGKKGATPREHAPTSLDYVAATAVGLMVLVLALAAAPGGLDAVDARARRALSALAEASGAKSESFQWVIKVVTVGGTLALSGGIVGCAIMALASVVVYAVFASPK